MDSGSTDSLLEASVARVLGQKDVGKFLQCLPFCFDIKEKDDDNFNHNPTYEYEVYLPANHLDADTDAVRVGHRGNVQKDKLDCRALGPGAVLQNLHWVQCSAWGHACCEGNAKDEDRDDQTVDEVWIHTSIGSKRRQHDVRPQTATQSPHHHTPSADPIKKRSTRDGCDPAHHAIDRVDQELRVGVFQAGVLEHFWLFSVG